MWEILRVWLRPSVYLFSWLSCSSNSLILFDLRFLSLTPSLVCLLYLLILSLLPLMKCVVGKWTKKIQGIDSSECFGDGLICSSLWKNTSPNSKLSIKNLHFVESYLENFVSIKLVSWGNYFSFLLTNWWQRWDLRASSVLSCSCSFRFLCPRY